MMMRFAVLTIAAVATGVGATDSVLLTVDPSKVTHKVNPLYNARQPFADHDKRCVAHGGRFS